MNKPEAGVFVGPLQMLYDRVVVAEGTPLSVHPWLEPLPPSLYKYFPPERLHILTDCKVRFSQRQAFDDEFDLRPKAASFGTAEEMRAFMEQDPVLRHRPTELRERVIASIINDPRKAEELLRNTQRWMTTPEEFAVFSLCENFHSAAMWNRYAGSGKGFVVAFETQHPCFSILRSPGIIGKVEYSDRPYESMLSSYGAGSFFRKRNRFQFEAEWRSLRAIHRLNHTRVDGNRLPIYLAPFRPECVREILMLQGCSVEWELRTLAAVDARYRHIAVNFCLTH
jgi:hypothetical protein